jgi:CRP-like cAMP-binding protein
MNVKPEPVHAIRDFDSGQVIIRQGSEPYAAYLIQSGLVEISEEKDGVKVRLATLGPGQIFGEMALLGHEKKSHVSATALEHTSLVVISSDTLEDKLKHTDPTIRAILSMLMQRLYQADDMLLDNFSKSNQSE